MTAISTSRDIVYHGRRFKWPPLANVGIGGCVRRVRRRFPVGASPTRHPFQPEATGAGMRPAQSRLLSRGITMPFVNIKIAGLTLTSEHTRHLQKEATALMAGVLGKKAELTSVLVEQAPASGWSIGGQPLVVAAHLDAKVTAGTNTAAEKARFIAGAHALLKSVAGPELSVATYVVVDELPADAWGYDGLTQAHRAGALAPAK
jgi:4-oxalocrotonate tautomerase